MSEKRGPLQLKITPSAQIGHIIVGKPLGNKISGFCNTAVALKAAIFKKRTMLGPQTGKFSPFVKTTWRQENFRPGNSRQSLREAGVKRICAAESIFQRFAVPFAG